MKFTHIVTTYWNTFFVYIRRDEKLLLHVVLGLLGGFILLTLFVYLLPNSIIDSEFSEEMRKLPNSLQIGISLGALFLIFSIPFLRVYLRAHWFADVAAGVIIGLLCLVGNIQLYLQRTTSKFSNYSIPTT